MHVHHIITLLRPQGPPPLLRGTIGAGLRQRHARHGVRSLAAGAGARTWFLCSVGTMGWKRKQRAPWRTPPNQTDKIQTQKRNTSGRPRGVLDARVLPRDCGRGPGRRKPCLGVAGGVFGEGWVVGGFVGGWMGPGVRIQTRGTHSHRHRHTPPYPTLYQKQTHTQQAPKPSGRSTSPPPARAWSGRSCAGSSRPRVGGGLGTPSRLRFCVRSFFFLSAYVNPHKPSKPTNRLRRPLRGRGLHAGLLPFARHRRALPTLCRGQDSGAGGPAGVWPERDQ